MKRFFFFILLLSLLVAFGNEGWVKLYKLRQMDTDLAEENRLWALQNEKIRREIDDLKDPKYLERLIRNDMGFAREGEILFEFVERQ